MDMQEIIEQAERNIRQALRDYGAHTTETATLDDVSDTFIARLAEDSSYAKQGLRELFSKSPVWHPELDALIINGTRTHNPDYGQVEHLARKILRKPLNEAGVSPTGEMLEAAINFFTDPESQYAHDNGILAIKALAPKAYAPGKKPSRVFKALCAALGVADETAGSMFQRWYAQLADELSAKKIDFKLYVSINPAHFITMSNPKWDTRGACLTSCHSFNSTEYEYNCGCSGYAKDDTTFIVFTVDDPHNPETLNNRKTTRQIFAYQPGNGLLLQSRMYNTAGGVCGAAEDSKLYRDLIQREISALEDAPNLWKTGPFCGEHEDAVITGEGFGGYPDWTYKNFDAHISIRADHADDWEPLTVGTYGLCIECGCETNFGLYCDDCRNDDRVRCDECEDYFDEEDLYPVRNESGDEIYVCEYCRERYYTYCDDCGEYWPDSMVIEAANGRHVCDNCLNNYERCEDCGEYYRRDDMKEVQTGRGYIICVCERCRRENYTRCDECGEYYPNEDTFCAYNEDEGLVTICKDCCDEYEVCPVCGETVKRCEDGTCPACGVIIDGEDEVA